MKIERVLVLFLVACAFLVTLWIMFAPLRAEASLVINYPSQIASTTPITAVTATSSRLITGPFYAVTDLPLTLMQKWDRIKELQAEIARLRDLLATLSR